MSPMSSSSSSTSARHLASFPAANTTTTGVGVTPLAIWRVIYLLIVTYAFARFVLPPPLLVLASCDTCCAGGSCAAAFHGDAGTCCGTRGSQPFCCPTYATCTRVSSGSVPFRCVSTSSERTGYDGRTDESGIGMLLLWISLAFLLCCCCLPLCFAYRRFRQEQEFATSTIPWAIPVEQWWSTESTPQQQAHQQQQMHQQMQSQQQQSQPPQQQQQPLQQQPGSFSSWLGERMRSALGMSPPPSAEPSFAGPQQPPPHQPQRPPDLSQASPASHMPHAPFHLDVEPPPQPPPPYSSA